MMREGRQIASSFSVVLVAFLSLVASRGERRPNRNSLASLHFWLLLLLVLFVSLPGVLCRPSPAPRPPRSDEWAITVMM